MHIPYLARLVKGGTADHESEESKDKGSSVNGCANWMLLACNMSLVVKARTSGGAYKESPNIGWPMLCI
jgi:hypothetical protein